METPHAFNNLFPIPLTKGSYLPFISEFQDLGAQVYLLEIELGIGVFVGGAGKGNALTTKTDLEASSTSKVAFGKNTYCTLFGG
ncbi:hypothetical protein MTR_3g118300 [Medicago truncatula]|uniref:Uncharacterized protein n=1 Tax=Medicago truncatula TaxID=3880 RepID=G7J989_MEDTR|nr:hypothetical protein MTR_3g118300 [Medicago truncatula]